MTIDLHTYSRPWHVLDLLEAFGLAHSKAARSNGRGDGAENTCVLLGIG
jgi:hypothetical protein